MTDDKAQTNVKTDDAPSPAWRRLLSRIKATSERVLHPVRRKAALEQLRQASVGSVLFVCEGNIYRSPFAAHLFAACLPESLRTAWRVGSAGFVGPDRPSPEAAQALALEHGVDLTAHRSTQLNGAMATEWELVVVMEDRQATALARRFGVSRARVLVLGDLDPERIDRRTIVDPWKEPEKTLRPSYARVERCVRVLVDALVSSGSSSSGASAS